MKSSAPEITIKDGILFLPNELTNKMGHFVQVLSSSPNESQLSKINNLQIIMLNMHITVITLNTPTENFNENRINTLIYHDHTWYFINTQPLKLLPTI